MQCDVEEFYLSISEDLLKKVIDHAKVQYVDISGEGEENIMHCRKSLLFNNTDTRIKEKGNKDFDVTMGSLDRAEVCELVGLYIFTYIKYQIWKKC